MKYSKECCGSILEIEILDTKVPQEVLQQCFETVIDFENKYSRFKRGNILDQINTHKSGILPSEIITLLELCIKISKLSQGHFDITMQPLLENHGYGVHNDPLPENIGYQHIKINGDSIQLDNDISIEFGSFGKGYLIDLIYHTLTAHSQNFVINFGGDIRACGTHSIMLEDPYDTEKQIASTIIKNGSIASSSGNRRFFGSGHHLLNPQTKNAQNDKIAVYVTHPLGIFADIFSTALFVSPLELSLDLMGQVDNLKALIITAEGKIHKTHNFDVTLSI